MEKDILFGSIFLQDPDFSEDRIREGLSRMTEMKMNTVVVWPPVHYENGKRSFKRHLKFLDLAAEYGLKVIIELTGQVVDLEYMTNDIYRDEYGVTDIHGNVLKMQNGLGEMNFNYGKVRTIVAEMFRDTVNAYKKHPALFAWDIWNETHFKSFDKHTLCEFRKWLAKKYGTVGKLNFAWAKTYTEFDQVEFEECLWSSVMPYVDLEDFRTDNIASMVKFLADCVKRYDTVHPVITDNVMSNAVMDEVERGTDDWKISGNTDIYGISFYPKTGGRLLSEEAPWLRCLTFDGARSAGCGKFFVSEMQSHSYSEIYTAERVSSEEITTWAMEAFSRSAKSVFFWKLYPFRWGQQIGGRGLVLADGSMTERAEAAKRIGEFIRKNPELSGAVRVKSSAGILFDRKNIFNVKAINNRLRGIIGDRQVTESLHGIYKLLFSRNTDVEIVAPVQLDSELGKLKTLFLSYQVALDDSAIAKIEAFVRKGGTLVGSHPFLDIDGEGKLRRNLSGGPLNRILGFKYTDNIMIGKPVFSFGKKKIRGGCPLEIQKIEFDGKKRSGILAEVNGNPLVLSILHGKGKIIYFTTPVWNYISDETPVLNEEIYGLISDIADLGKVIHGSGEAKISVMKTAGHTYLFVFNYGREETVGINGEAVCFPGKPECVFGDGELELIEGDVLITGRSPVYVLKFESWNNTRKNYNH